MPALYLPNECLGVNSTNDYLESIAQARFVQLMSVGDPGATPGVIGSGVQWEVAVSARLAEKLSGSSESELRAMVESALGPGEDVASLLNSLGIRPDVLLVPGVGDMRSRSVFVAEVKGSWNRDAALASAQVTKYVAILRGIGINATAAPLLGYEDRFEVLWRCVDGESSYPVRIPFRVFGDASGVLTVTEEDTTDHCEKSKRQKYSASAGKAFIEQNVSESPGEPITLADPELDHAYPQRQTQEDRDWLKTTGDIVVVAGVTAVGAKAAVDYVMERQAKRAVVEAAEAATEAAARQALLRGAGSSAFRSSLESFCIGVVNPATRPPHSSMSPHTASCLELTNAAGLAAFLADLDIEMTPEQLAELEEALGLPAGALSPALVRADPHLVTPDGLSYDFHGVGEFVLLRHPLSGFEVQSRFTAAQAGLSSVGSIALRSDSNIVELRSDHTLIVNGEILDPLTSGDLVGVSDGLLIGRSGNEYQVLTTLEADASQVLVRWTPRPGARGDFGVSLPDAWSGELQGLLGNFDQDPSNDLRAKNGTDVTSLLGFGTSHAAYLARLYGTFGDSWRITDPESLFTYPSGMGTASFTDSQYPTYVRSLSDVSESERLFAEQTCRAAGVPEGIPMDDCILDVGSSGDDSFAHSLTGVMPFSVELTDAYLDELGLTVGFTGAIPQNFLPSRVRMVEGVGNVAGPFTASSESYDFHLSGMRGHDRIHADVTLVTWNSSDAASVRLDLGGDSIAPVSVEPIGTHEDADGSVVHVSRVRFDGSHSARALVARLWAAGEADAFAVSSINLSLNPVPEDRFDLLLDTGNEIPLDAKVGFGAGVLERPGASDVYCADLDDGATVTVDASGSGSAVAWHAFSPTSSFPPVTKVGGSLVVLQAEVGEFCVEFFVNGPIIPNNLRYRAIVFASPAPQVFEWDLTDVRRSDLRGLPPGGSSLESRASVDSYQFTVPAGGSPVVLDWFGGISANASLVNSEGTTVWSWDIAYTGDRDHVEWDLPAGSYTLHVAGKSTATGSGVTGPYQFQLFAPSSALTQTFPLTLQAGSEATTSAPGAGVLETSKSTDVYPFTVPGTGSVVLTLSTPYTTGGAVGPWKWQLRDGAGIVIDQGSLTRTLARTFPNLSGDYTLTVQRDPANTTIAWAQYTTPVKALLNAG